MKEVNKVKKTVKVSIEFTVEELDYIRMILGASTVDSQQDAYKLYNKQFSSEEFGVKVYHDINDIYSGLNK